MYATLASSDVDCCLIPESLFYLKGNGELFEHVDEMIKVNRHMVIVIAEKAGEELLTKSLRPKRINMLQGTSYFRMLASGF